MMIGCSVSLFVCNTVLSLQNNAAACHFDVYGQATEVKTIKAIYHSINLLTNYPWQSINLFTNYKLGWAQGLRPQIIVKSIEWMKKSLEHCPFTSNSSSESTITLRNKLESISVINMMWSKLSLPPSHFNWGHCLESSCNFKVVTWLFSGCCWGRPLISESNMGI